MWMLKSTWQQQKIAIGLQSAFHCLCVSTVIHCLCVPTVIHCLCVPTVSLHYIWPYPVFLPLSLCLPCLPFIRFDSYYFLCLPSITLTVSSQPFIACVCFLYSVTVSGLSSITFGCSLRFLLLPSLTSITLDNSQSAFITGYFWNLGVFLGLLSVDFDYPQSAFHNFLFVPSLPSLAFVCP